MGKPHIIIAGLGFGDEGKGSITDYLCSTGDYRTVVRYNGGANAGHNVVSPTLGRHHTFSQFGSGTFHPYVHTHLSRFMMVDPLTMASEYEHLKAIHVSDALDRLSIDGQALLITPFHREANRQRETRRGDARHGSCGVGIGETRAYALKYPADAPQIKDCLNPELMAQKLKLLQYRLEDDLLRVPLLVGESIAEIAEVYWQFARAINITDGSYLHQLLDQGPVVFEGAQGVLIDENYGFPPYNTWSNTTFENAETLLKETGHKGFRLGVLRTYMTRHGAGPFVTEDPEINFPEPHNTNDPWQGPFRQGHFDAVALRYALMVAGGADGIALTHFDTVVQSAKWLKVCVNYDTSSGRISEIPLLGTPQPEDITRLMEEAVPVYRSQYLGWPKIVEQETGVPVIMGSTGPSWSDKIQITGI